jgi:Ca2+-binding RTX toxin-like protein
MPTKKVMSTTTIGSSGDDVLFAQKGVPTLYGGPGDDLLFSNLRDTEIIAGGEGDDTLFVGVGVLTDVNLFGGPGENTFHLNVSRLAFGKLTDIGPRAPFVEINDFNPLADRIELQGVGNRSFDVMGNTISIDGIPIVNVVMQDGYALTLSDVTLTSAI